MAKKTEEKNSAIPVIICIVVLIGAVMCLPFVNNIFWNSNTSEIKEEEEEKEIIPSKYQCSYGPAVDSFYNYIKSEYVIFDFDEKGNISTTDSEIKYQATSLNEYNQMLEVLDLTTENVTYDKDNYVVTVRNTVNTTFPQNYKELKQYLSTNQYTCVEE